MRSVVLALALASCTVSGSATFHASVVYIEPPPPQLEHGRPRAGFVYINGRWDRKNGQWLWAAGHYERERIGFRWEGGRWERRGNSYQWIDGQWLASDSVDHATVVRTDEARTVASTGYPTMAPPPLRIENAGIAKRGWQTGHWDWREGQWIWLEGRREAAHADEVWTPGRWESQGNYYVWIEGRWTTAPSR